MAETRTPESAKPFCALLAGDTDWLDGAERELEHHFGAIDQCSDDWSFQYTDYYESEMGLNLVRRIVSFQQLIDPADIVDWKLATNGLEHEFARDSEGTPARPVNLDPGYIVASKLVLATTKNFSHRIYLDRGIYAEVTLQWSRGAFRALEWTYPDYSSDLYRKFFRRVRERYMDQTARGG